MQPAQRARPASCLTQLLFFVKADENGLIDFNSEVEVRSLYFDLPKFKVGGVRVLQREDSPMKMLTFNILILREEPIKV
jgi:hypothetical protein